MNLLNFDRVAEHLTALGTLTSPAELHGLLCGRLCGGARYDDQAWLEAVNNFLDLTAAIGGRQRAAFSKFYRDTLAQLQDHQLGFGLLLPVDEVEMPQRIEALGQWCYGFLNGFGTSGITRDTQLSADTAEALRDFAAFAQLDRDSDDDEQGERDFTEIVEYVRVAALSVFMETGIGIAEKAEHSNPRAADSSTLH